ncbi:MAG: 1-acyl-sn-glycerol-3-phosphate acyltransferase [Desulfosarcina sp.]|nr:1-acyl-sn-glycerol-3-phosphate acyltransferase [Desulfobacterales bacterium]
MGSEIFLPWWLFILILALAGLALLDRLFIPSVRWFWRRRINRVVDEIGQRLNIEIRPFQLTKRQVLIDRLAYAPQVLEVAQKMSRENNEPLELVQAQVLKYAREIVPAFNAYLYFRIGYWIAKRVARLLYHVRIGLADNEEFAVIPEDATVVFVMNHRSNMDYILVAFLAAERTTLSYAVGEWARIWPLQTLIRSMGAFFVRRNSGNALYRCVLKRYISMATHEGVCQAVFLEGGLSRDGRLRKPKLGFLDYMLRDFDPAQDRDVIFIPVGINYDRVIEDRSLLYALDPEAGGRSTWFVFRTTIGFILKSFWLMGVSRWQRFGYACVNFGTPVSVKAYCRAHDCNFRRMPRPERFAAVEQLAGNLMEGIRREVAVLPVPLLAAVFCAHPQDWMSAAEIEHKTGELLDTIAERGFKIYQPGRNRLPQYVAGALSLMRTRYFIEEEEGRYRMNTAVEDIMRYYANSIAAGATGEGAAPGRDAKERFPDAAN